MKKPMPAPIASFICTGMALMIILRTPVTLIRMKMTPEMNTPANAADQE